METTHDLLDLICLYCGRDPVQEGGEPQQENTVSPPRSKPQGDDILTPKKYSVYVCKRVGKAVKYHAGEAGTTEFWRFVKRIVTVTVCSGGVRRGGEEKEREVHTGLRPPALHLGRKQQRRENLQPAARERHTVLLCSDQRHGEGRDTFSAEGLCTSGTAGWFL